MTTKKRMKASLAVWKIFLKAGGEAPLIQDLRGFQGDLKDLGSLLLRRLPDVYDYDGIHPRGRAQEIPQRNDLERDYLETRWAVIQKFDQYILHYLMSVVRRMEIMPPMDSLPVTPRMDPKGILITPCMSHQKGYPPGAHQRGYIYDASNNLGQTIVHHLGSSGRSWQQCARKSFFLDLSEDPCTEIEIQWQAWTYTKYLRLMILMCNKPIQIVSKVRLFPAHEERYWGAVDVYETKMTLIQDASDWSPVYDTLSDWMEPFRDKWGIDTYAFDNKISSWAKDQPDTFTNLEDVLLEYLDKNL